MPPDTFVHFQHQDGRPLSERKVFHPADVLPQATPRDHLAAHCLVQGLRWRLFDKLDPASRDAAEELYALRGLLDELRALGEAMSTHDVTGRTLAQAHRWRVFDQLDPESQGSKGELNELRRLLDDLRAHGESA